MDYQVAFSPEAEMQLQELETYLAERFSPANAERYIERVIRACASLSTAPHRGTQRDDVGDGVRTIGFERRATIYFKVLRQQVLILGIFYGGRSLNRTF